MNSCLSGNTLLWILIILLVLNNGNILNSSVLTGCGLPILIALGYCMYKNGTLRTIFGGNGCGCNN